MTTAFTGSLGWTGLHPFQLGGPPLTLTFDRTLPALALPFLAHAYQNDGVTPLGSSATFKTLTRPTLSATLANGGYQQITLEVAQPIPGLTQGNVIRLSELGGDDSFVFGGIVESLPDSIAGDKVTHEIVVTPFGIELGRAYLQVNYTTSVDVSQMVRDACAATQHVTCDPVSVPPWTGLSGQGDFRNRPAQELLDTARAIAGATWFWHVDELGRLWFQSMGSGAVYTLKLGKHYAERSSNGGDIDGRLNDVLGVGGIPAGSSASITARYTGASQSTIGVRSLNPPLQMPNITDLTTLQSVVNSVGAVLDRTWQRVDIKALPSLGARIHASRPGGAMLRYWEPDVHPMRESEPLQSYRAVVLGDGPTAAWWLDDSGATAIDSTGHGYTGTYQGSVTHGVAGAVSSQGDLAASFDGSSGLVEVGGPSGLLALFQAHDWTVEYWVKPTTAANFVFSAGQFNNAGSDNFLHIGFDGSAHVKVGFFGDDLVGGAVIPTASWTHIAVTWAAATKARRIYVNGVLDASDTSSGSLSVPAGADVQLARVSFATGNGPYFYNGALDEMAVYGSVLTAGQVQGHYQAGLRGLGSTVGYVGPFVVQSVDYDGLGQAVQAGDIPVTDQRDIDSLIERLVGRQAAQAVTNAPASLNQPTVLASGGTVINPVASLGISTQTPNQSVTATTFGTLTPSIAVSFTLTRTVHCLIVFRLRAKTSGATGTFAYARVNLLQLSTGLSVFTTTSRKWDKANTGQTEVFDWAFTGNASFAAVGPGTYTAQVEVSVDSGQTGIYDTGTLEVFQCGT